MSSTKIPVSLRGANMPASSSRRFALVAAASISAAAPVAAQDTANTGVILLPTVEVETSEPVPAPGATAPRQAQTVAPRTAAAQPDPAAQSQQTATPKAGTGGRSAYADPEAPYNAQRSGNSLLPQPLAETARTVTAVTQQALEDKNATSVRELARTTPGITLGTGEGGNAFGDVFFIRGFRASNDMFVDGQRNAGVSVSETFNAEQVEVTKGPTGSIAGRGTTGGAINVVSKSPQHEDFINAKTTVGSADLWRQTFDINHVWNDSLRTRLNLMAQKSGVAGRDNVKDDRSGIALAAEYDASDRLMFSLDVSHTEFSGIPDWGVPWDPTNGIPFTEPAAGRPKLDRSTFYGNPARDFHDATQSVLTLGAEYQLTPQMLLTSRLRTARSVNDYVVSAPERPDTTAADPALWTLQASPKNRKQTNDILSSQTELSFDAQSGRVRHELVLGLDATAERVDQQSYQGLSTEVGGGTAPDVGSLQSCTVTIYDPDIGSCVVQAPVLAPDLTETDVNSLSLYLNDTMTLRDDLILNMGLRLDHYEIQRSRASGGTTTVLSRSDTFVNGNVGLTWKLRENGMVYASVATSTDPMGQSLDAGGGSYGGLDSANVNFPPEQNLAFELGTKWTLGELLLSAAVFETVKRNAIETSGRGATATASATGKYAIRGIELGLSGNLTERLSLFGGASVLDSRILASSDPANLGLDLANIAHQQFNLLAKYQMNDRWSIGGQATWRGRIKGGTMAASNGNTLPGYWRFDAFTEHELVDNVLLALRVDNLFDTTYYDALYRSGSPFVYVAPGRSVSASISFTF